jgi:hypothetical protein
MITIQNITGGQRHQVRTIASLARLAADQPLGGWTIVQGEAVDHLDRDSIHAVMCAAEAARQEYMSGRGYTRPTTSDWEKIADLSIRMHAAD